MTDADIILPVCATNRSCHLMASVAIRTLRASTDASILVLANNTPDDRQKMLERECGLLGLNYLYMPGPFNIAKAYNFGATFGTAKYIVYATSDVIYFPGWLDNLITMFEQNPHYFCLCNYSFDIDNNPCARQTVTPETRIVDTHNPSSGVIVFKRETGYKWDEQFPLWEIDTDLLYYIESKNLRAGYCCNSRCDHLIDGVKIHVDLEKNFETVEGGFHGGAKARVRAKWGDRYKGGA